MKRIAIIPARGGSIRIPRKNIKPFLGIPIIAYSVKAALESKLFDTVMVSTDDDEIAEVAKKFGADVPFLRSSKNADDFATTVDVLKEVLHKYKSINQLYDVGCCLYPAAPLILPELLIQASDKLVSGKFDSVITTIEYSFPIQRACKISSDGKVSLFYPEHLNTRSQDLEKSYHDAGQFYFFDTKQLLKNNKLIGPNTGSIILGENDAQDIDNISDWNLAELKFQMRKQSHKKK